MSRTQRAHLDNVRCGEDGGNRLFTKKSTEMRRCLLDCRRFHSRPKCTAGCSTGFLDFRGKSGLSCGAYAAQFIYKTTTVEPTRGHFNRGKGPSAGTAA